MNFTWIRAFHAVASQKGFTRAAEWLGVSQPAISGHVQSLERQIGQSLFERRGHSVNVTPVGEALLQRTRNLFAQVDELDDFLLATGRLERGVLRIAADSPYGIMDLLRDFRSRRPHIELRLRLGNMRQVTESLEAGESDVALVTAADIGEQFVAETLRHDRIVAIAPPDHPLAAKRAIPLAALDGVDFITRERSSATRMLFEKATAACGIEPNQVMELGSREAVREAVAAGIGLSVVFGSEQPEDPRIRQIGLDGDGLEGTQFLLTTPERRRLLLVDALFSTSGQRISLG
ncbi:MAG: LysR substrate-binding domain-containing protein [Geminicoccaceae bacterium]